MKHYVSLCIAVLSFFTINAQFGAQQIISSTATGASKIIPYDVNSDGFIDVLSNTDYRFGWYQNLDGLGNFGDVQYLSETIGGLESMKLYDLNNDEKLDIVYSTGACKIAWLENLDNQGNFGAEQIIAQGNYPFGYPYSISIADIDGDGDLDVFANLYHTSLYNRLVWYENVDGLGNFSDEILIEIGDFYGSILLNFDLDNDGDLDLITSYESFGPSTLIWYENLDGLGNLSESQTIYEFEYSSDWVSIYNLTYSDINGDGKTDLLLASYHDDLPDYIYWLENLNAQGDFGEPQIIHTNETTLGSLRTYDLDNDNDQDILASYFWGDEAKIAWFENLDGDGSFGPQIIISTEVIRATDASAADLNSDGKMDVISASQTDTKVAWYQNLGTIGVEDYSQNIINVYPNPTNGLITITSEQQISTIDIFNIIGQKISKIKNQSEVNLSSFDAGIYFLKINDDSGNSEIHKIIKE
ncbi:MAG: hypothetical protein ACI9VJ_000615 [Salibacteraceae bacterium]|jgi:hypothetical protein